VTCLSQQRSIKAPDGEKRNQEKRKDGIRLLGIRNYIWRLEKEADGRLVL
jgi:hypothetical protein